MEHFNGSARAALEKPFDPALIKTRPGTFGADVRYQLLVKTRVPSLQQCHIARTERQITEALETVCAVQRAVDAGHFYRNRSWACQDCPFRWRCDGG